MKDLGWFYIVVLVCRLCWGGEDDRGHLGTVRELENIRIFRFLIVCVGDLALRKYNGDHK
jgi:hypothetical protein